MRTPRATVRFARGFGHRLVVTVGLAVFVVAVYVVVAAVAGVLAAVGPARSAAKVDVLKAVVTD